MRRGTPWLVASMTALALTVAVPAAHATFRASATGAGTFGAATLGPASSLGGTSDCGLLSGTLRPYVDLSWTATSSMWASGYVVRWREVGSSSWSGPLVVQPRTTTTARISPLSGRTDFEFEVRATAMGWTSLPAVTTVRTKAVLLGVCVI